MKYASFLFAGALLASGLLFASSARAAEEGKSCCKPDKACCTTPSGCCK